ncbi:MAG: hypothetical protein ACO38I_09815 [Ilumatobacteraceae bacterium]
MADNERPKKKRATLFTIAPQPKPATRPGTVVRPLDFFKTTKTYRDVSSTWERSKDIAAAMRSENGGGDDLGESARLKDDESSEDGELSSLISSNEDLSGLSDDDEDEENDLFSDSAHILEKVRDLETSMGNYPRLTQAIERARQEHEDDNYEKRALFEADVAALKELRARVTSFDFSDKVRGAGFMIEYEFLVKMFLSARREEAVLAYGGEEVLDRFTLLQEKSKAYQRKQRTVSKTLYGILRERNHIMASSLKTLTGPKFIEFAFYEVLLYVLQNSAGEAWL